MTTLRIKKEFFYGIYLLLPLIWLVLTIILAIEHFRNDTIVSLEKILFVFGSSSLIPLFLSFIFLRYKLTFDEEKISYRNFLTKKNLRFDEIDYARFEHGYKDKSEKFKPSFRFVIYPKSQVESETLIINCGFLENFKALKEKFESDGKLKRAQSYSP